MEELKHFSHDHPLILIQIQQNNNSDKSDCYACGEPVLAEPTYNCRECNEFLHKRCAELPLEMMHPLHPEHPLKLVKSYFSLKIRLPCRVCNRHCRKFTYYCEDCELGIHGLCAEGSTLDHPSHHHPLTMVRRVANFECDACGDGKDRDESYMCTNCTFWIHKRCSLLPSIYTREDHPHPLSLAYSFPILYRKYQTPCDVCAEDVFPPWKWVYYCGGCRHFVHLRCITKPREKVNWMAYDILMTKPPEDSDAENLSVAILPTDNFVKVIKIGIEKERGQKIEKFSAEIKAEPHEHSLILLHLSKDPNSVNQIMTCNRCTEPIISSCYHCTQCNYSIHLTCSQLPEQLQHTVHDENHTLDLTFHPKIRGTKICRFCKLHCNGGFYRCSKCHIYIDIKCALLPNRILHKAHEHPLCLMYLFYLSPRCKGCGLIISRYGFTCEESCRFFLGYECASLPRSIKHRWDKHELLLSFPPFSDQPDELYCEICEEEINPTIWQYRCGECDQSFHPNCVAESRNIIFGQTVKVSQHQHTITSVPEGDLNSSCNSCRVSLYRKRAFKCASCRYYKCFICMP